MTLVPCGRDQLKQVEHTSYPLHEGDSWYLVEMEWFMKWKRLCQKNLESNFNSNIVGRIENSRLCDSSSTLKRNLCENEDYKLLAKPCWSHLCDWYGFDGVELACPVVKTKDKLIIEVYPLQLSIYCHGDESNKKSIFLSKVEKVSAVKNAFRMAFPLFLASLNNARIGLVIDGAPSFLFENDSSTLEELGIEDGNCLVIESQNPDGSWPISYPPPNYSEMDVENNSNPYNESFSYGISPSPQSKQGGNGLVGLSNLGNTCFMNSALQCLSNTVSLSSFFISGKYKKDINRTNKLGMGGEVAEAFGNLIKSIWSTGASAVIPREFKMTISRFSPQFSGYQQHDSQELLSFLLDGLHEDLNRIIQKPYIEIEDQDDRPDQTVADELWHIHKQRNDSIIVDLFHGQFKSTVICPDCQYVSVTFDPFMYLSLPLPSNSLRSQTVSMVFLDISRNPVKARFNIPKHGTILDLKNQISEKYGVPVNKLVVSEIFNSNFHTIFYNSKPAYNIGPRDEIVCYEIEHSVDLRSAYSLGSLSHYSSGSYDQSKFNNGENVDSYAVLRVLLREVREEAERGRTMDSPYYSSYRSNAEVLFGFPLMFSVPRKIAVKELYHMVHDRLKKYFVGDTLKEIEKDGQSIFTLTEVKSSGSNMIGANKWEMDDVIEISNETFIAADFQSRYKESLFKEDAVFMEETDPEPQAKSKNITLNDCLELFTKTEKLGADDPWYCKKCKKHQEATKKFDLWKLPEVLVVHLKRFSYNRIWRDKIDTIVDFPLRSLDLSKFVIGPNKKSKYDLFAISNHYGGLGGGHYTAYAKNHLDGRWYDFDDSRVSPIDESKLKVRASQ